MKQLVDLLPGVDSVTILLGSVILIILAIVYRQALKWYVKELIAMWSDGSSFFSKKRIESGIAFLFALSATIYYMHKKIDTLDMWSFGYILTTWLFIAGYTVNQIQKEKTIDNTPKP